MCAYGLWLATTTSNVGLGIEGDAPWFFFKRSTKRVLGVLATAAGLLLLVSALLGDPLL
jgi:hypothetical protein